MHKLYTIFAVAALALVAGCAQFQVKPPQSPNEAAAYQGATVQSLQQTAIAQYPYMTKAQATEVHELLEQAEALRKDVVQALLADLPTDIKVGNLQELLLQIQALLAQYGEQP